jgi:hypothetical protein
MHFISYEISSCESFFVPKSYENLSLGYILIFLQYEKRKILQENKSIWAIFLYKTYNVCPSGLTFEGVIQTSVTICHF